MIIHQQIGGIHMVRAFAITDGAVVRINGIDRVAMRHKNGVLVIRPDTRGSGGKLYIQPRSREWVQVTGQHKRTNRFIRKKPAPGGYRANTI